MRYALFLIAGCLCVAILASLRTPKQTIIPPIFKRLQDRERDEQ